MISRPRVALLEKRTEQQKIMFAKSKLNLARINMTEPATLLQAICELHEANEYLNSVAGYDAEKSLVHAMYRIAQCIAIDNQIELADEDKITYRDVLAIVDAQLSQADKAQVSAVKSIEYDRFMSDVTSVVSSSGLWIGLSYKLRDAAIAACLTEINTSLARLSSDGVSDVEAKQIFDACEAALASATLLDNENESLVALAVTIKNTYSEKLLARFTSSLAAANENVQALKSLEEAMEAARSFIAPHHMNDFLKLECKRLFALFAPYEKYVEELNKLLEGEDAAASAEAAVALKKAFPLALETNLELMELSKKIESKQRVAYHMTTQVTLLHQYILLLQRNSGNDVLLQEPYRELKKLGSDATSALNLYGKNGEIEKTSVDFQMHLTYGYALAVCSFHDALCATELDAVKAVANAKASVDRYMQVLVNAKVKTKVFSNIQWMQTQLNQLAPAESQVSAYLRDYNVAKEKQNHADLLVVAEKLLATCATMTDEASYALTQMRPANIYCDMAAATLAQSPNNLLASQQAIVLYQKAINTGVVDVSVYDALLPLLEAEMNLHRFDHMAKFHRENFAHYKNMRQQLLPSESAEAVVETVPVNNHHAVSSTSSTSDDLRPASPTSSAKDKLIAMSIDDLFKAIEIGGEVSATEAWDYFKRTYGRENAYNDRLLMHVISRLDGDNVRYANPAVLMDLAHGIRKKCYVVPAAHQHKSSQIYLSLLKTVMANGDNARAALAAQFMAQYYDRRYNFNTAKQYYLQSGERGRLCAHVLLSDIYTEQRRYVEATAELNKIIQHSSAMPGDIQAAHQGLAIVNYLVAMNEAEKNREEARDYHRLPSRPMIYFDLDNTIFLSAGSTNVFFADDNNVPHAASKEADINKFFNGGIQLWRDIFAELRRQGFGIGICTARPPHAVNACPLYHNFVRQFPELINNNSNIIFTNGEDKHPFLSDACHKHQFKYMQRQFCILVDDNTQHLREAAAVGLTVINVNHLTKELSSDIYDAFKTHVLDTAKYLSQGFTAWLNGERERQIQRQRQAYAPRSNFSRPQYASNGASPVRHSASSAFQLPPRSSMSSSSVMYQPDYRASNIAPQQSAAYHQTSSVTPLRPAGAYHYDPARDPRLPRRSDAPVEQDTNDTTTADNRVKRSRTGEY